MSLARWGCDGSDVYVFDNCDGYIACWDCPIEDGHYQAKTDAEMHAHLLQHIARGDTVPASALDVFRKRQREDSGVHELPPMTELEGDEEYDGHDD